MCGESPPPPPRACFGREELIEKVIGLAESLTPVALIGAGGIGKTSIALTVLHHDRIKKRFGDHRRFIRCDKFTTSCAHFLSRLSEAIGAGTEGSKDLASLRPFLFSNEVLVVLDNAESILDPQGVDAQEIYGVVEELSQLRNVCLCITSRISIVPSDCETVDIPTLSIEAARDAFYRIYKNGQQTNLIDDILDQLDFHPLSITLLATVAHCNKWGTDRLTREWETRRTNVLQTKHKRSLAAAVELSLSSPLFQELGPDARALLGVVAFFPQGVNENSLDRLFPTIPDRENIFDQFCIFSLAYRSDGFITMLAPLRDYLSPKDPISSPLLRAAKEYYSTRMSVEIDPNKPDFGESRWITLEDVNVERLLDIFTVADENSDDVWTACAHFMQHLFWHKKRLIVLKQKIQELPDDHSAKPKCLFELSRLLRSVGNDAECKRLLTHTLTLQRERNDDSQVARTLMELSDTNRLMDLHEEGIQQAKEALQILDRIGDTTEQAHCLTNLAWLLRDSDQLEAARETASRAADLSAEKGDRFQFCQSHRILGGVHQSKGETRKAIRHYEVALKIASSSDWRGQLFWIHYCLADLFFDEDEFGDAQVHVESAKSHAANSPHNQGLVMELQARVLYKQRRFDEARSEALRATEIYERLGAAKDLEDCRELLQWIDSGGIDSPAPSDLSGYDCELLQVLFVIYYVH